MRLCRSKTVLALLVLLLVGLEVPAGLALCVADDGHAAIELAHAEQPCTSHLLRHHPEVPALGLAASDLDGHPCRDIPLLECSARREPPAARAVGRDVIVLVSAVAPPARALCRPDPAAQRRVQRHAGRPGTGVVLRL